MFPITITLHNQVQFRAVSAALSSITPFVADEPVVAPEKAAPVVEVAELVGSTQEECDRPITSYEQASTAVVKLSKTKGRDAAVALLATFGATNLKEIKPQQFCDVVAAVEKALG